MVAYWAVVGAVFLVAAVAVERARRLSRTARAAQGVLLGSPVRARSAAGARHPPRSGAFRPGAGAAGRRQQLRPLVLIEALTRRADFLCRAASESIRGQRVRPHRDRRRNRRLRRGDPRRPARPQRRRRREAEGARRHLSAGGLHSDQGAARARARAEDRAAREGMGRHDRRRRRRRADRHRHGAGPRAQGPDRRRPHQRHRVPVQEEQDRLDQRDRAADRAAAASTSSRATPRRCARGRRSSSRPDRRRAACRASRSIASASSPATKPST